MIDINNSLFNINIEAKQPSVGSLLVAEPFLREQYFNHAVIYLVDYSPAKSAMGLVLNKKTGYSLNDLLPGVELKQSVEVYAGGPMSSDRLFYIHRIPQLIKGALPVGNGLFIGGDFDDVCSYVSDGLPCDGFIRFFIGYSGWGDGQLDSELQNHVWGVADVPANFNALSNSGDSYWHTIVKQMGLEYRNWSYMPMNPSDN